MIIDRYLVKEVAQTLLAVTVVLLLIVVSNRLIQYLADAAEGKLPGDAVFALIGLKAVVYFGLLIPLALYLGILLGLGRLYRDSEMAALAACGVGTARIYRALLILALPLVAGLTVLTLYVGPKAAEAGYEIQDRAKKTLELSVLSPGRFRESGDGRHILYVEHLSEDRRSVENVFAHSLDEGRHGIVSSETAYQYVDPETGDRFIVLTDGYRYEGVPGQADFRIMQFEKHAVRIEENREGAVRYKRNARPTATLWQSSDPADRAELQWRLSVPLSAGLLALLAVPLARVNPRQGRYGKLFVAIVVYIVYVNLLSVAQVWVERGTIPSVIGLWWVHGLVFVGAVVLLVQQAGLPWVKRVLFRSRAVPA